MILSAAQRGEFRRGRLILLAAVMGLGCGIAGVPLYSFGFFIAPLMEHYSLGRTQVSGWATVFTLGVLVAASLVGPLTDRYGARHVTAASLCLLALAYALTAIAEGSLLVLYATALLVAVLGAGTLPVTFTKTLAGWFSHARGLAFGLAMCGVLLGATISGYVVPRALERGGLFAGYLTLALLALCALPVVWTLLRENARVINGPGASAVTGDLPRDVLGMPVFWLMGSAFFVFCAAATGIVIHLVPSLLERGLQPAETSLYVAALSAGGIAGRLLAGWAIDRVFAPRLVFFVFLAAGVGCFVLAGAHPGWTLLAVVVIGFAVGAEVDLIAYLAAAYFGLRSYATIYGWLYALFALGASVGPVSAAWIRESTGGYPMVFFLAGGLSVLAAAIFLMVGRHPYRYRPA
jgi:MFS family permease